MLTAMATKKKVSKKRPTSAKKKPVAAGKKIGAARKASAPKKAGAAKKASTPKKAGAAKKASAPKQAGAAKKPSTPKKASPKKAGAAKKPAAAKGAPPKAVASKKRTSPARAVAKVVPVHRRDGAGHLDPQYAATLRDKSREGRVRDADEAFIGRSGHTSDNLAEAMGETWVETATSGEDENEEVFNQNVPEDEGGPFVTTTAGQEFAEGTDASNPKRSKREAFPKT
jgi:hypothetical protein